jgi:carboxyl-terminal processing protease
MILRKRFLVILLVIFSLLACRSTLPSQTSIPIHTVAVNHISHKATYTPFFSATPLPSSTFTPEIQVSVLIPTDTFIFTPTPTQVSIAAQYRIFDDLWDIVNENYIYPDFNGLDWASVHDEFYNQISSGLSNAEFYLAISSLIQRLGDDHSYFLTPQEVAEQESEFKGSFDYVGIGVYVSSVPERQRAVILSVSPGSPAEAAGLKPRDSLLAVDGIPILDEDGYLRDIVRGPEGSGLDVTVQSPGEQPRQVHLVRQKLTANYPVAYQVITTPQGKQIGYIFLLTFMVDNVDEQVAAALEDMYRQSQLDGLILDNRMNEGGSSWVMEPVLGYFAGGTLGSFVSRTTSTPLKLKLHPIDGSADVPLAVLVGSGTASFGEIFSGILQDIGRANVLGTTTEGNVEILTGYDFEDGSELWLASETFRPLNHPDQDWEKSGIIPDITVPGGYDQYSFEADPVILAAVQYLTGD